MKPTKKLSELLDLIVASSQDTQDYEVGDVPFVTSAEARNGVVALVKPRDGDKVFEGPCLVISGLGFATAHTGRILPKGNGGDSCTVGYGKEPMSIADYLALATAFNLLHSWRFSYGRKCGIERVGGLAVPYPLPSVEKALSSEKTNCEALLSQMTSDLKEKIKAVPPKPWKDPDPDASAKLAESSAIAV